MHRLNSLRPAAGRRRCTAEAARPIQPTLFPSTSTIPLSLISTPSNFASLSIVTVAGGRNAAPAAAIHFQFLVCSTVWRGRINREGTHFCSISLFLPKCDFAESEEKKEIR